MSFNKLNLMQETLSFLEELSLKSPTPVQEKAIPFLQKGLDVCTLAPTGSGKTLAYLLPILEEIKKLERESGERGQLRAIILSPTRELTTQICSVAKKMTHHLKLIVRQVSSTGRTRADLGKSEILVGNPANIMKAFKQGMISLKELKYFVLDEADQLFDSGFYREIKVLRDGLNEKTCLALFSATWDTKSEEISNKFFDGRNVNRLMIEGANKLRVQIETINISMAKDKKDEALFDFLKLKKQGQGMVFFNTKTDVDKAFGYISKRDANLKIKKLHGGLLPKERKQTFKSLSDKNFKALFCTDIGARGIDLSDLNWIVNYDLPSHPVYYIHRAGRTGREGQKGHVFNFLSGSLKSQKLIKDVNEAIKNQVALKLTPIKEVRPAGQKKISKTGLPEKKALAGRTAFKKKTKKTPRYKRK